MRCENGQLRLVTSLSNSKRALVAATIMCCVVTLSVLVLAQTSQDSNAGSVRVDATPNHAINSFDPDSSLGSSLDVLSRIGIDRVYTPHIIQESLSAGWGADQLSQ